MTINEYNIAISCISLAVGFLLARWTMNSPKALVHRIEVLVREIHSRMSFFSMFIELTPGQNYKIITGRSLETLDELFDFYQWGMKHRFAAFRDDPITNAWLGLNTDAPNKRRQFDIISLVALAVICEKFLGLTRAHAVYALLQAKRPDDYRSLLRAKEPPGPSQ